MLTSRAEYRLLFNHGSSEIRYLEKLRDLSLVSSSRLAKINHKFEQIEYWFDFSKKTRIENDQTLADLIRKGRAVPDKLSEFNSLAPEIKNEVLYKIKYEGYLSRELKSIEKLKSAEKIIIPKNFNFLSIKGLRKVRETSIRQTPKPRPSLAYIWSQSSRYKRINGYA